MKLNALILPLLLAASSHSLAASYNSSTPLGGITPITFDEVPLAVGAVVTDQFSGQGITFGNTAYFDSVNTLFGGTGWSIGSISGSHIGNFDSREHSVLSSYAWPGLSLKFNTPISSVVVGFAQGGTTGNVVVEAFLNGVLVESFSKSSSCCSTEYLGFTDTQMDELRITNFGGYRDVLIDNVQVSSVPVPAAIWLFGSGLLSMLGMSRKRSAANK